MNVPLVMTVIGRDRPGLVDRLAGLVAEYQGNWLEGRMSHLGGHFAGILRVTVPEEHETALVRALKALDAEGLSVVVHADTGQPPPAPSRLALLELVGQDRPGIVRQIAHALALHGVNVEELNTGCESAAMSGESLFRAEAKLHLPSACDLQALRRELEQIAADLMVDVNLQESDDSTPS